MFMDIAHEADQELRSDEEDTVYDRSNPFHSKNSSYEGESELRVMIDESETRCGIGSWRPISLQKYASRPVFSVFFTVVAVIHGSFWTYYTANISTFERRFKMDSITSGILLCSNELAQFLVAILFSYFGFRRHRAKLLTMGVVLSSISCFFMASPHFFLGSGEMAKELMINNKPSLPSKSPMYADVIRESSGLSLETKFPFATSVSSNSPYGIVTSNVTASTLTAGLTSVAETLSSENVPTPTNMTSASIITSPLSSTSESPTVPSSVVEEIELTTSHADVNEDKSTQDLIPLINDEMKTTWPICSRHAENINIEDKKKQECKTKKFERKLAFSLVFCANFFGGIASMLYLLSGGPFAEDSTILPNELPRIFGITMAVRLIGAFLGYLFAWSCLSEFIDPLTEVTQIDSRWLGAYWLGWTFLGIFLAIFAMIFSLFPRQAPREFLKKRSLTHETGMAMYLVPNTVPFFGGSELKTANPFPSVLSISNAIQGLMRNKVYALLILSIMIHVFFSVGYLTFLPKYMEFMFRLKANDAAMLTGISNVPFQVAGLMLGGAFISRYLPSPKEISHWSAIVTGLKIVGLTVMAFLGCNSDKIDVSFLKAINEGNSTTELEQDQHCSADCGCEIGPILPICDLYSGTTFYSPCHAGCETESVRNLTFSQCSCLSHESVTLVEGFCPTDSCINGLIAFMVFVCLTQFLNGSSVVGRMLISYKALQADQRNAIIGFTLVLVSVFAVIPSPIVFGSLLESACLVREEICPSSANAQIGNCWLYDETSLRFAFNLSSAAILVLALIFDVILWKTRDIDELRIYDGELRQLTTQPSSSSRQSNNFATVSLS